MLKAKKPLYPFSSRKDLALLPTMQALVESRMDAYIEVSPRSIFLKPSDAYRGGNFPLLPPPVMERFVAPNKAGPVMLSKYHHAQLFGDSLVVSRKGKLAKDCVLNNRYFNERGATYDRRGILSVRPSDGRPEKIDVPCYFPTASGLIGAYTHWFTEIITRLAPWFEMPEPRPKILFDDGLLPYQREMLHKLGIHDDMIILKNDRVHYKVRTLYLPGTLGLIWMHADCFKVYDRLAAGCDMDKVRPEYRGDMRRIYMKRVALRDWRWMVNLDSLFDDLEARGYRPIVPEEMNLDEKLHVFGQAEQVIGEAGGGMTNIVFCKPGTKVLVLSGEAFASPIFTNIAAARDLPIAYVIGAALQNSVEKDELAAHYLIAPSVFREALEAFERMGTQ
jgi:hypothetical protein